MHKTNFLNWREKLSHDICRKMVELEIILGEETQTQKDK